MRIGWVIIGTLLLLYGCSPSINDSKKRNENWCWFIDKATGKGKWIPVANETTVDSGYYSLFYSNGKVRETGKIANRKNVDTVCTYDISGQLLKYTFLEKDTTIRYYLFNGPYIEFTPKCQIAMEATVSNHVLGRIKWNGAFGHYVEVMKAIRPSNYEHIIPNDLLEVIEKLIKQGNTMIPAGYLNECDSSINSSAFLTEQTLKDLNNISPFYQMPELQKAAIDVVTFKRDLLKNQVVELIGDLRNGLGEENKKKILAILNGAMFSMASQYNNSFAKAQMDFQKKFPFTNEQYDFLEKEYPELFNQK